MTRHFRHYTVMGVIATTAPETARAVPLAYARTAWGARRWHKRLVPLHTLHRLYVQRGEQT